MSSARKLPDYPSPQYAVKQEKPKLRQQVERTLSNAFFRETHYNSIIEQSPTYFIKHKKVYYQGRWKQGLPHGRGIAIYSNHSYFQGNFENGEIKDPDGFLIMPNGAYYKGNIENSVLQGKGILKHDSYKYEGNWANGKPEGKGAEQYGNGIRYVGDFVNGLKEGRGIYVDSSKVEEYQGQFKLGYMWGEGTFKVNHKLVYEGQFERGKKVGAGKLLTEKGVLSGYFQNDVINGEGVFEWNDGKVYRGQFRDSLFHGEGVLEMRGGKKLKGVWVNGHNDKLMICDI